MITNIVNDNFMNTFNYSINDVGSIFCRFNGLDSMVLANGCAGIIDFLFRLAVMGTVHGVMSQVKLLKWCLRLLIPLLPKS